MNRIQSLFAAGLVAVTTFSAGVASAATVSFGPVTTNSTGAVASVDVAIDPNATLVTGFTLIAQGDFSFNATEYVDITIDGLTVGRIFDGNTANDPFDITNDVGNDFAGFGASSGGLPFSTSAALNLDISGVASDGFLTIAFDTGDGTNFQGNGTGVFAGSSFFAAFQGSIQTSVPVTSAPIPAAGLLLLTGFGTLGVMRRRKMSRLAAR